MNYALLSFETSYPPNAFASDTPQPRRRLDRGLAAPPRRGRLRRRAARQRRPTSADTRRSRAPRTQLSNALSSSVCANVASTSRSRSSPSASTRVGPDPRGAPAPASLPPPPPPRRDRVKPVQFPHPLHPPFAPPPAPSRPAARSGSGGTCTRPGSTRAARLTAVVSFSRSSSAPTSRTRRHALFSTRAYHPRVRAVLYERMSGWSSKASVGVERRRWRGLKARGGRRETTAKVLKDRRSPRRRGRMGTSV